MNNENSVFKKITLNWIFVSVILLILMVLLGLFMRTWQSNLWTDAVMYFYPVMTLHGVGMAGLWYISSMAIVVFVSRKYIEPNAKASYFSFGLTLVGVAMLVASTLFGQYGSGWTFLYPLPMLGGWPMWSTHLYLLALAVLGIGWLVWNLDYLRAVAQKYKFVDAFGWSVIAGKQPKEEVPPFIMITTIAVAVCVSCLVSAVAVLALFYSEILGGVINDALLMKNLTYFFGHLIVNLSMYLGVGVVYDTLPYFAKREWHNSKALAYAWNVVLIVVLGAYFHHLYMDFAQPGWMQYFGQIASYVSSIPSAAMSIFGGLALIYRAKMKWNLTSTFFVLGLMGWAIGGAGAVIDSTVAVNTKFHNTLWVPAHFHTYMLMGLVMIVLGYIYHFVHKANGVEQNQKVSRYLTVLYLVGGYGFVSMFYAAGASSIPRRYALYTGIIADGSNFALTAAIFVTIFLIAVLIFSYQVIKQWKKAYSSNYDILGE